MKAQNSEIGEMSKAIKAQASEMWEINDKSKTQSNAVQKELKQSFFFTSTMKLVTTWVRPSRKWRYLGLTVVRGHVSTQLLSLLTRPHHSITTQLTLQDIFKKITKKHVEQEAAEVSTLDNPLPSTSRQPDVLSPASTFHPRVKAVVPVVEWWQPICYSNSFSRVQQLIRILYNFII